MTDSLDINKAVSACRNLAKQFRSFSKVADVLEELGNVEKRVEQKVLQEAGLADRLASLENSVQAFEANARRAKNQRDEAIANRDKELEIQEAIAEDVLNTARDMATEIVAKANEEADSIAETSRITKLSFEGELLRVSAEADEAQAALKVAREEMAALKERL